MNEKDKFDELIRKEVKDLLKRQIYFSREILSLAVENNELKKKIAKQKEQLELVVQNYQKLKSLIKKYKK